MKRQHDRRFDPFWKDNVFDPMAFEIPLLFPEEIPVNNDIWVQKDLRFEESVLDSHQIYKDGRMVTSVIKPSDLIKYHTLVDKDNNELDKDHPAFNITFRPKVWMNNSGNELCSMLAAAKMARGSVLIGGMGLAVYPQFVIALNRPVSEMTIVECHPKIIEIVSDAWLKHVDPKKHKITIIQDKIENYLQTTSKQFDTIYLDTWDDAEPRFLPYVNYLIDLALRSACADDGQIQCWGYYLMLESFIKLVLILEKESFPWDEYNFDPAMNLFAQWRENNKDASETQILEKTFEFATTTMKPIDQYDRHRCFTIYGSSFMEAHFRTALALKDGVAEKNGIPAMLRI